jgi:hypothetical protein
LYHEKRIALVYNFVYLLPLKNIVQGRKGLLKVEKKIPWESCLSEIDYIVAIWKKVGQWSVKHHNAKAKD